MDTLRRSDKRILGWGLLGWLAICVIGSFWAFPKVANDLAAASSNVASFSSASDASVTWNGRDGYLTVPAGTENVGQIAADLAELDGARNVNIEVLAATQEPAVEPEFEAAAFTVDWTQDSISGAGLVPNDSAGDLNDLFGVGSDLSAADGRSLDAEVLTTLRSDVAPLIGASLVSGSLSVENNEITVSGVAQDAASQADIAARLDELGILNNITVAADAPASFKVTWDDSGATQTAGTAPVELEPVIASLGADPVDTADGLSVGANVDPALAALAPLISQDLTSGSVSVDGDVVVIRGTAPSAEALERATAALEGIDATVELDLSEEAGVQVDIDELLALNKIEFITATATPTAETEAIIDEVAATLTEFGEVNVHITGHTDSRGNDAANQALSEARAAAVVDGLVARGVSVERLSSEGKGETEPIETNETPEGQQANRRVEIKVKESE